MDDAAHGVGPRPALIVVMGLPGTGKTTLAAALAARLGIAHLSSDVVRKRLLGMRLTDHPSPEARPAVYNAAVTWRTYTALRRRADRRLRRGESVVLDATFGNPAERAAVARLAARRGARLVVLVCEAEEVTIHARLAARAGDPHAVSDARLEHWPILRAAYSDPAELPDALHLDMTQPIPALVDRIMTIPPLLARPAGGDGGGSAYDASTTSPP